eukprot:gb/GECG01003637.1/.p1 GENE.gb/GECG01003637.1/~~gb/GECG01003637.1/.p1  ORF type:complete len:503 (+),score=48.00 gb/GECG01003637.1/:1-1509(+)
MDDFDRWKRLITRQLREVARQDYGRIEALYHRENPEVDKDRSKERRCGIEKASDEHWIDSMSSADRHLAQGVVQVLHKAYTYGHAAYRRSESITSTRVEENPPVEPTKRQRTHEVSSVLSQQLKLGSQAKRICWDMLHGRVWKDVALGWRVLYAIAVRFVIYYDMLLHIEETCTERVAEWLRTLDLACMTTTPQERGQIQDIIREMTKLSGQNTEDAGTDEIIQQPCELTPEMRSNLFRSSQAPNKGLVYGIERVTEPPSLFDFFQKYMGNKVPVVIEGLLNEWPAFGKTSDGSTREWANVSYLKRQAGLRTVPVETGDHYMAGNWGQELLRFDNFIDRYVLGKQNDTCNGTGTTGYLAQHPLFEQIPELRQDILVPDYCALMDEEAKATGEVQINAWLGPTGTLSCLHNDPYHNLLAQVVGWKRVVLVDNRYRERLYPHPGIMSNTSQVDPDNPDLDEFPHFKEVPLYEALIGPGDTLYIPQGCWHQIRSMSLSFSVSFWW